MRFKYEDLEVWQISQDLIKQCYRLFQKFPSMERYALASQGRRAVVSIALNIAEGSGRKTDRDFSVFVNRAVTSLQEADAVLKIAIELGYLTPEDYSSVAPQIEKEYYKLVAFEKSLYEKDPIRRRYSDGN
jgi:four helix bundle protein